MEPPRGTRHPSAGAPSTTRRVPTATVSPLRQCERPTQRDLKKENYFLRVNFPFGEENYRECGVGHVYWPKISLPVELAHGLLRTVSASVSTCTLRPSRLTRGSGTWTPSRLGLIHSTWAIFCWNSGRICMFRYSLTALGCGASFIITTMVGVAPPVLSGQMNLTGAPGTCGTDEGNAGR